MRYSVVRTDSSVDIFTDIPTPSVLAQEHFSIEAPFTHLDRKDGTKIFLHLVCLELPESAGVLVDQLKKDVLTDHRKKVDKAISNLRWFFDEEIIDSILHDNTAIRCCIEYIESVLLQRNNDASELFASSSNIITDKLSQQVNSDEIFFVPLSFIGGGYEEGIPLFCNEFKKNSIEGFDIQELGNNRFLVLRVNNKGGSENGLGITFDEEPPPEATHLLSSRKFLFTITLSPSDARAQFMFFSKSVFGLDRLFILRKVREGVFSIAKKVNRLILLKDLNETRVARYYIYFLYGKLINLYSKLLINSPNLDNQSSDNDVQGTRSV